MGGSGKTCITSAVIRDLAVLQNFSDGIAWICLSQQPSLSTLLQRLHFQITQKHMPKGRQQATEREQHQYHPLFVWSHVL
jgi:hypothetical protein